MPRYPTDRPQKKYDPSLNQKPQGLVSVEEDNQPNEIDFLKQENRDLKDHIQDQREELLGLYCRLYQSDRPYPPM